MEEQDQLNLSEDLRNAVECIRKGGIILYPTDTIWGIGCDATNEDAVKKIYKLKQRADSKSMLVLVDSEAALERIVPDVPEIALNLIDVAIKPLTIIYDEAEGVDASLLGENNSLGIRITSEKFSRELCRRFGRPIVSTSANISGHKSPAFFNEIEKEIKDGVDYIVNFRRNDITPSAPSNIIHIRKNGEIKVIR